MKVKKSILWFTVLVVCIFLISTFSLISCAEPTEIRLWTFLDPTTDSPRALALREIIANFEEKYPDVKIKVEPQIWSQLGSKFFAAHQAGNAPDICWIYLVGDVSAGIKLGALENLYDLFIKDWSEEEIEDFYGKNFWNYGHGDEQGVKYHFTLSRGSTLIYYRKDLFQEAGITAPIQTWDKFIEAAKKLTNDVDNDGVIDIWGFDEALSLERPGYDASVFVTALMDEQERMVDDEGRALWATETGIKSMELETSLITEHEVVSSGAVIYTIEDNYERFASGRTAMAALGSVRYSKLQGGVVFDPNNIGVMLWPSWKEGQSSPLDTIGWSNVIWSGSKNKEIAGKFLEYMISPEADLIWAKVGGQIPVRSSTLETLSKEEDPSVFISSIVINAWKERAWVWSWDANMKGVMIDLRKASQEIVMDGKDIKEALLDAEESFNSRQ